MEKVVKKIMIVSFIIFAIWMIPNLGKILVVVFLAGLSILVGLYRRILPFYLGIELLTFTAVVACYMVHPLIAWVLCLIVLSSQAIMTGHITIHYFIKIGVYTVVVIFCSLTTGLGVETAGKAMAIFINLSYFLMNALMGDMQGLLDTPGNIINIFLNFWLFSKASGIIAFLI